MTETFEKLWNEYFAEECASLDTKEEKTLIKRAAELHETVNRLMTKEQKGIIEKYIEVLYEIQGVSVKKAFFKGCEFATSFFFESGNFGKR